tara:strand:- start:45 stop:560 length:516 start_codon:yes stop_codon:yes gene_type:complete
MRKVLHTLRSIALTIVGLAIAFAVTLGLHELFFLFIEKLPMEALSGANWSERSVILETYMAANPFAIYGMIISNGMGAALAVYFSARTAKVPSGSTRRRIKPFTGAIVLLSLWIWRDVQSDLYDIPVGLVWTTIDVLCTIGFSFIAFSIAGGFRKHGRNNSVTSEETIYRG